MRVMENLCDACPVPAIWVTSGQAYFAVRANRCGCSASRQSTPRLFFRNAMSLSCSATRRRKASSSARSAGSRGVSPCAAAASLRRRSSLTQLLRRPSSRCNAYCRAHRTSRIDRHDDPMQLPCPAVRVWPRTSRPRTRARNNRRIACHAHSWPRIRWRRSRCYAARSLHWHRRSRRRLSIFFRYLNAQFPPKNARPDTGLVIAPISVL